MKRLSICFALLTTVLAAESHAQWWGGGYAYSNYYNRGIYVDQDRLPYFALHPPVYYSYPVPRSYGYSPFAYPGTTPTPDSPLPEAGVLVNPYVTEEPLPAATPQPKKTGLLRSSPAQNRLGAVTPLRIANPFVGVRQVAAER